MTEAEIIVQGAPEVAAASGRRRLVLRRFLRNKAAVAGVLMLLTLVLLAYVAAAVLAKPDLGEVMRGTFIPTIEFNRDFLTMMVAVIDMPTGTQVGLCLACSTCSGRMPKAKSSGTSLRTRGQPRKLGKVKEPLGSRAALSRRSCRRLTRAWMTRVGHSRRRCTWARSATVICSA